MLGMFFILWGVWMPPMFVHPCTFVCPLYIHTPSRGVQTPHMFPILLCASVCSQRLLRVIGGCKGLPYMLGNFPYTTPVWGCLPLVAPPHSVVGFPVHQYVLGISICHVGIFPFCWGCSPSVGGFRGTHQHL